MIIRHLMLVVLGAVLLMPSYRWIATAWQTSPQDASGWVFAQLALAWWLLIALMESGKAKHIALAAMPFLLLSGVLGGIGFVFDIRAAIAGAALATLWSVAWAILGTTSALLLLPSLLIGMLALPTSGFLVDQTWLLISAETVSSLKLKALISTVILVFGGFSLLMTRQRRVPDISPLLSSYGVLAVLSVGSLLFAFQPPNFGPPAHLDQERWAFGDWLGAEISVTPAEQRLFERARLSKRAYAKPDGSRVAVLIVEADDIHRLHAPEYCLTGSGWQMGQRERSPWVVGHRETAAALLTASRQGDHLKSVYWFSSASRSTTDLMGLRLQNRLAPQESFTLYMVTAIDNSGAGSVQTLQAFLAEAPWKSP